jgi:hypothetical protein
MKRINPLLTANNPGPIPGCHAPVKALAHSAVVLYGAKGAQGFGAGGLAGTAWGKEASAPSTDNGGAGNGRKYAIRLRQVLICA